MLLPMAFTLSTPITLHYTPLHNTQITKLKPVIHSIKCLNPNPASNKQSTQEDPSFTNRRNAIISLGFGASLYSHSLIATAAPEQQHGHATSQTPPLSEFGSEPQLIEKTVRTLVSRPKQPEKKGKVEEVLVVDGIEVNHNGAVKFDVYIAKAHDGVVGPELGAFAGSLVNMPYPRVAGWMKVLGVKSKGSLELGITGLVKDIEAQDCDKVAVTLVPSLGPVVVGGVRIDAR